jgi:hypothetical protein
MIDFIAFFGPTENEGKLKIMHQNTVAYLFYTYLLTQHRGVRTV